MNLQSPEKIDQSIAERFLEMVDRFPENIAIIGDSESISYIDLALQARRVASALQMQACHPGSAVVIALEDPKCILAAILGTLMMGCIYVPIEADFPQERIEFVVKDVDAKAILIGEELLQRFSFLPSHYNQRLLVQSRIDKSPLFPLDKIYLESDVPASILYTSGSMGKIKGVLQTQRNILFHVDTLTKIFNITDQDKHSVLSSFIFDGSTTDLYCSLLNGATLVPINVRNVGAEGLAKKINQTGISLYHSTPTTYRVLVNQLQSHEILRSIRLIILGGEAVTKRDYELYLKHFSDHCVFVNGYGATETSGFVALFSLSRQSDLLETPILPIGKAPDGINLKLQDGELLVESEFISLGYWNNPELTGQRFENSGSARIFRTGDLANLDEQGNILLLGRKDRQLKIRGFRVDLSEIEAHAMSIPEVHQTAVKTFEDPRTNTREIALFVTLKEGSTLSEITLRKTLSSILPIYMVPTLVSILEKFPLTDTGKINSNAITIPELLFCTQETNFNNNTEIFSIVMNVWQKILAQQEINPDDNFFDLGGTSLLMARVHADLLNSLSRPISLHQLFEYPSVSKLVAFLEKGSEHQEFDEILSRAKNRRRAKREVVA